LPTRFVGLSDVSGIADVNLLRYANVLLLRANSVLCLLWHMKNLNTLPLDAQALVVLKEIAPRGFILGHRNIQNTVRYSELAPNRFGGVLAGLGSRRSPGLPRAVPELLCLSDRDLSLVWGSARGTRFVGEVKQPYPHPGGSVLTSIKKNYRPLRSQLAAKARLRRQSQALPIAQP
jgi:hypothetical protein